MWRPEPLRKPCCCLLPLHKKVVLPTWLTYLVLMHYLKSWLEKLLSANNILKDWVPFLTALILLVLLIAVIYLSVVLVRKLLIWMAAGMSRRLAPGWHSLLVRHRLIHALSLLLAVLLFKAALPVVFEDYPNLQPFLLKLTDIYFLFVLIRIVVSFLNWGEQLVAESAHFRDKPVASYFQLGRLLLYIAGFVLALSILMGKSPLYFLGAFGAMTAVLLLVFKDTILGLVASVQISSNDMVRVGDWIEMPKFDADGDVLAINLNTVKVKNWDGTITTIPTHYFISESFRNWRGMQESGGRRIKRSLFINIASIRFVNEEMRDAFKRVRLISDYVKKRQQEIETFNAAQSADASVLINGRRLTNIGVFRKYITTYLRHHTGIHQDMILVVRQLAPTAQGLPLEIYCFTKATGLLDYEAVQSDIFDHLFAATRYFGLEIYQSPAGSDMRSLAQSHLQP